MEKPTAYTTWHASDGYPRNSQHAVSSRPASRGASFSRVTVWRETPSTPDRHRCVARTVARVVCCREALRPQPEVPQLPGNVSRDVTAARLMPSSSLEGQGPPSCEDRTSCWGGMLKRAVGAAADPPDCEPGFVPGPKHFKNKFCAKCRNGVLLRASCVRAATPALAHEVRKRHSHPCAFH